MMDDVNVAIAREQYDRSMAVASVSYVNRTQINLLKKIAFISASPFFTDKTRTIAMLAFLEDSR